MPLYDFSCEACSTTFDEFARPGETAPCPACGSDRTRRVYTAPSPPQRIGMRGAPARESNARRAEREHHRKEQFKAERRRKREGN